MYRHNLLYIINYLAPIRFSGCMQTQEPPNNSNSKPAYYKESWHHFWAVFPARSLRTRGQPVTMRQSDRLYKYIFIVARKI